MTKLDGNLTRILYSTLIGGSKDDGGRCIAVSPSGEIVIAGQADSPDFPRVNGFDDQLDGSSAAIYAIFKPRSN